MLALALSVCWVRPTVVRVEAAWLTLAFATYFAPTVYCLIRWRTVPSYHTWGAKVYGMPRIAPPRPPHKGPMPVALQNRPRLLAALVFGGAGLLLPTVWFLPVIGPRHNAVVVTLYIGLPGLAAAVAGAVGEPWLDPARCRSGSRAVARGAGIAAGALVVFAPLLALGLKWTEPGWTNPLGLTALILWFSLVAVGWAVAVVGGVAGWLVWRRRQRTAGAVDSRSAKT